MPNPFSDIVNQFSSLFKSPKASSVVGIDIGSSSIKVVQIKKENGRVVLDTYGELSLGPLVKKSVGDIVPFDPVLFAPAIKELLHEANITATSSIVAIQTSSSLILVMKMPYLATESKKQMDEIVLLEARKHIPIPINQVAFDYWMIPMLDSGFDKEGNKTEKVSEVLVATVRNESFEKYKDIIKTLNFTSDIYEIEIFSAIRSSFRNELSSVVLVDFGARSTRIAIVNYGVVRLFHSINRGSVDITYEIMRAQNIPFDKAEELKKQIGMTSSGGAYANVSTIVSEQARLLFDEIKRVIINYEKTNDKTIGKMILVGGGARTLGIREMIEKEFSLELELADPFQKVDTPKFLDKILKEVGPEFAVAVGLALNPFV